MCIPYFENWKILLLRFFISLPFLLPCLLSTLVRCPLSSAPTSEPIFHRRATLTPQVRCLIDVIRHMSHCSRHIRCLSSLFSRALLEASRASPESRSPSRLFWTTNERAKERAKVIATFPNFTYQHCTTSKAIYSFVKKNKLVHCRQNRSFISSHSTQISLRHHITHHLFCQNWADPISVRSIPGGYRRLSVHLQTRSPSLLFCTTN
jgi:hypothetical protein